MLSGTGDAMKKESLDYPTFQESLKTTWNASSLNAKALKRFQRSCSPLMFAFYSNYLYWFIGVWRFQMDHHREPTLSDLDALLVTKMLVCKEAQVPDTIVPDDLMT